MQKRKKAKCMQSNDKRISAEQIRVIAFSLQCYTQSYLVTRWRNFLTCQIQIFLNLSNQLNFLTIIVTRGLNFLTADHIGHSVANGSSPLRHFFKRSCVICRRNGAEMGPAIITRYTLRVLQLVLHNETFNF